MLRKVILHSEKSFYAQKSHFTLKKVTIVKSKKVKELESIKLKDEVIYKS